MVTIAMRGFRVTNTALLLATLAISTNEPAHAGQPRPIALTGTDGVYGPGLGAGVVFTRFDADGYFAANPVQNNTGQVLFVATLSGPGVTSNNDTGLWVYRGGGPQLIAREGDNAPDNPAGVVFGRFGMSASPGSISIPMPPNISDSGVVAFKSALRGTGVDGYNDDALFLAQPGGPTTMVLRERVTELPDHPGILLGNSSNEELWWGQAIRLAADGRFAIRTRVLDDGSYNDWDVTITNLSGTLETFYHGSDSMPAPYDGVFWSGHNPVLNDNGVIAQTRWNTSTTTTPFSRALWSTRTGTLAAIVKEGDPVVGGGTYRGMSNPDMNSSNRVAFLDRGDDPPLSYAIFTEGQFGIPVKIATDGSSAPGTAGGAYFLSDFLQPIIGDSGVTVFRADLYQQGSVDSTNNVGVWANRSGLTVQLELRKGNAAPGAGGALFEDFQTLYLNAQGRVAVVGTLNDATRGLWLQDASAAYTLIARGFTTFDVFGDGSDIRLATDVVANADSFTYDFDAATGDGRRIPLNDHGDVVFRLQFIDGSEGIFTTARAVGDTNCDGTLDLFDIDPFVIALTDPDGYAAAYPACNIQSADCNQDGEINLFDIDPFVLLLTGG